jgi:hypothetical protein
MRIMTNYLQIIAASMSYNLKMPSYLLDVLTSAEQAGNSSGIFLSFDWLLMDTYVDTIFDNVAYLKVLCVALLPPILIGASTVLYAVIFINDRTQFKRYVWVTVITVIFVFHAMITQYAMRVFKCAEIGDGYNKVEMDITVDWFSGNHLKWIFALGKYSYSLIV